MERIVGKKTIMFVIIIHSHFVAEIEARSVKWHLFMSVCLQLKGAFTPNQFGSV